jgi:hypothetical protein
MKMKKLAGDEDVSSVSEDGSWFQRLAWGAFIPFLGVLPLC